MVRVVFPGERNSYWLCWGNAMVKVSFPGECNCHIDFPGGKQWSKELSQGKKSSVAVAADFAGGRHPEFPWGEKFLMRQVKWRRGRKAESYSTASSNFRTSWRSTFWLLKQRGRSYRSASCSHQSALRPSRTAPRIASWPSSQQRKRSREDWANSSVRKRPSSRSSKTRTRQCDCYETSATTRTGSRESPKHSVLNERQQKLWWISVVETFYIIYVVASFTSTCFCLAFHSQFAFVFFDFCALFFGLVFHFQWCFFSFPCAFFIWHFFLIVSWFLFDAENLRRR